ncbi:MAG: hypothetical protein AB7E47_13000 [Desulfovibrionaceae bacterium]
MSTRQLHLINNPLMQIHGLNVAIKSALATACRESHLSREQILDRINQFAASAGVRLTSGNASALSLATLEKWLNPSESEHVPTLRGLAAICHILGTLEPLSPLAGVLGGLVINEEQRHRLMRAELDDQIRALKRRKKLLEADL